MKARQSLLTIVSSLVILTQLSQPLGYVLVASGERFSARSWSASPGRLGHPRDAQPLPVAAPPHQAWLRPVVQPQ